MRDEINCKRDYLKDPQPLFYMMPVQAHKKIIVVNSISKKLVHKINKNLKTIVQTNYCYHLHKVVAYLKIKA